MRRDGDQHNKQGDYIYGTDPKTLNPETTSTKERKDKKQEDRGKHSPSMHSQCTVKHS